MAKINLKVLTDIKQSEQQLKALATSVESIAKSFSSVKVDKNLTAQINALTKHYNAVAKAAEKVAKVNYNNEIQTQKLAKATAQANKAIADEATAIEKSKTQFAKHQKAVNDDTRAQEKHEAQMKKSTAQTKKSTEQNKKHSQSIASMLPNILKWQVAMTAVMLPLKKLREALDSINETLVETEKRVIALRRVAGEAANSDEIFELAQKYGQTFENVSEVVELLVKSGYEWSEAIKAAEPALLAINVAELDATQATEGLIAVVKQYGMELEDLNYIQGVLNKTADNAAVTTEKLLIALQKTGSTADNANISFEETVGLITAISEGTAASGQNIGNALRSLIVFTSDSKALDKFASLSDNMSETVKNFRSGQASILDIWKGLGIELQSMNSQKGTLEDLFGGAELSADIEAQLTQITDSFAEIYGTAGNYRQNYFIALLENLSTVEKVTNNLNDANTYSQKENLTYLESYEAKTNALQAKWQEIANDEQGFLAFKKGMVDAASSALDLLEAVGGIKTVVSSLAIAGATLLLWFKPTIVTGLVSGLKSLIGIIPNAIIAWKSYAAGVVSANTAMSASIPVIGLLLVAITTVTSAVSAYNQAQKEANQETINTWKSHEESSKSLNNLLAEYEKMNGTEENYANIEEDLVKLLGEKASLLKTLTKGTDDYRKALIELSNYQQKEYQREQRDALWATEEELKNHYINNGVYADFDGADYSVKELLDKLGIENVYNNIRLPGEGSYEAINILGFNNDNTAEGRLANYRKAIEIVETFDNEIERLLKEGDINGADLLRDHFIYKDMKSSIANAKSYVYDYLKAFSATKLGDFEAINNLEVDTEGELNDAIKFISDSLGVSGFEDDIKTILLSYIPTIEKTTEDTTEATNEWGLSLDNVLSKMKEIRDVSKEEMENEKKKKEFAEAEEALRKAQENRTSKIFNASTGQWEWRENTQDVLSAQEKLDELRYEYEMETMDKIIDYMKSGDGDLNTIVNILQNAEALSGGYFGSIRSALGLLRYNPVSTEQFSSDAAKFGLLYGSSMNPAQSPIVPNTSNVNNSSHTTIYISGVPITVSDAQNYSVFDLIKNFGIVNN